MRKFIYLFIILSSLGSILSGCEDLIDVNLNSADPRIVIEADLDNIDESQVIYVSRTVPFDDHRKNEIISDAIVEVEGRDGQLHPFRYSEMHEAYVNPSFHVIDNTMYTLRVQIDGDLYEAQEHMSSYIEVDSTGILKERIFGDDYYFATFRFQDPADIQNYYKYNVSVNGSPMKFYAVFNDKFNDGLYVNHQVGSVDNDITEDSFVIVKRQIISQSVYKYWNEIQSVHPGSVAPANPASNISNGALGYFSVSSAKEYLFDFATFQEREEDEV